MKDPSRVELNIKRIKADAEELNLHATDIAKIAGVSLNTAKNVLLGGGSEPTILKVERALKLERKRQQANSITGEIFDRFPEEFSAQIELAEILSSTLVRLNTEMLTNKNRPADGDERQKLDALERHLQSIINNVKLLR